MDLYTKPSSNFAKVIYSSVYRFGPVGLLSDLDADFYITNPAIFDDVKNNAMVTAILVYMACEDNATFPRDKADLGIDRRTGQPVQWPAQVKAMRTGPIAPTN